MTSNTNTLNSLLRGEIAAIETYNQAIEKFANKAEVAELRQLRDEHTESANLLRQHVHEAGGTPSSGSGWWGTWASFVEGTAQMFGETAALKALKEGEEHGIKNYQAALDDNDLAAECKDLVRSRLLPRCQNHVPVLDRLMNAQKSA